jgi:hypothetical protein
MNTKTLFLVTLWMLRLWTRGQAGDGIPITGKTNEEWQVHIYPEIGLKMRLPRWEAEVSDHSQTWSLAAYALVEDPAADVQYRVLISANRYTESQYLRLIRNCSTNSSNWSNCEHLLTSQMTNAFWIYSRRDIWRPGGFSYPCTGRIKRIQNGKPIVDERFGGSEGKLADEVRQILDSIEVLSTNAAKAP